MNKDVIYIDTEDDVTAIIGKVKAAKEKVVALVPPKRTGVLQSAVNLRILLRTTKSAGKHLVLITNDSSLIPLAAEAGIPVAKNLQSRPEVPDIPALIVDDDDDIIDGSQLPVGDHASSAGKTAAAAKHIPVSTPSETPKKTYAAPPKEGDSPRKSKAKSSKVPNFNSFRKKLILIILGVLLLIGFIVWAVFFAPRATVELSAKTSNESIATAVTLAVDGATSAEEGTLRALKVEEQVANEVEFEATGTEERGEHATGTITVTRTAVNNRTITIPVGTGFSNGDYTFTTTRQISLEGPEIGPGGIEYPQRDVPVKATQIGDEYNLSPRSYESTVGGVSARGGAMSGGSRQTVKIVTQADVQKASEQLAAQGSEEVKKQLTARFPRNATVIDSSFRSANAEVTSTPEVGDEAPGGKAKLTSSITYAMNGVSQAELEKYIEKAVEMRLSKENEQRIYDSGVEDAAFAEFSPSDTGGTVNLSATSKIGPQVKDDDIKKRVAGKRFGEIQSDLKSIQGIDDVDVKFWPFWVSTVPDDNKKIDVKFNLSGGGENNS